MFKLSKIVKISVRSCFLITLIKCLKQRPQGPHDHSLCGKSKRTASQSVSKLVTRAPIELFWTAKNLKNRNSSYRIIEHDSSHNCCSSKEKNFVTNTLHACGFWPVFQPFLVYMLGVGSEIWIAVKEINFQEIWVTVWIVINLISKCNSKWGFFTLI